MGLDWHGGLMRSKLANEVYPWQSALWEAAELEKRPSYCAYDIQIMIQMMVAWALKLSWHVVSM